MLLWHRPVDVALIRPLAWEPPYSAGVALKKKKKKKKKCEKAAEEYHLDKEQDREDNQAPTKV